MLLIIGAVIALIALIILFRARPRGGASVAHLGTMSDQWLAECRASHQEIR